MLVESKRVRRLLSSGVRPALHGRQVESSLEPKSYRSSMNPIPALIIFLLGMMMSSHHQESMVSSMMHKQWGVLLAGAAFARGATYIMFYLAPPTSIYPGRPPTELITSFCLMSGGFIFMASVSKSYCILSHH